PQPDNDVPPVNKFGTAIQSGRHQPLSQILLKQLQIVYYVVYFLLLPHAQKLVTSSHLSPCNGQSSLA
ncbi:hypothetical protein, partial [Bacillus cereus]|uniref:hypothetical protein n=1 Tax=Bacillus cereus TaxID=1396 RepID=UPI0020BFEC94